MMTDMDHTNEALWMMALTRGVAGSVSRMMSQGEGLASEVPAQASQVSLQMEVMSRRDAALYHQFMQLRLLFHSQMHETSYHQKHWRMKDVNARRKN
jgi:hypothetical protein